MAQDSPQWGQAESKVSAKALTPSRRLKQWEYVAFWRELNALQANPSLWLTNCRVPPVLQLWTKAVQKRRSRMPSCRTLTATMSHCDDRNRSFFP
jgi:hypothetical protein